MGRPVLPPGHGLWIPSTNGIHMFFMRFAIDAVFLGKVELGSSSTGASVGTPASGGASGGATGGTGASAGTPASRPIVGLRTGLPAWIGLVPLVRGADGVLELPIGTIRASGSQLGDRVQIG